MFAKLYFSVFNSNFYFKFTLHSIKIHQGKGFTVKPNRSTKSWGLLSIA